LVNYSLFCLLQFCFGLLITKGCS